MSIETDISNALFEHIEALAITAPYGPLSISAPNIDFTPPDLARYLELTHFRNGSIRPTWGDEKTLIGIFQVTVVDPLRLGEIIPIEIASIVSNHFAKNTILYHGEVAVKIIDTPTVLSMVQEGHRALFPVSIPYQCFKP